MSEYSDILAARNGRDIRFPISETFKKLYDNGKSAGTLNGYDETHFGKKSEISKIITFDKTPVRNSAKLVTSGGIWSYIGDIDNIDLSLD